MRVTVPSADVRVDDVCDQDTSVERDRPATPHDRSGLMVARAGLPIMPTGHVMTVGRR